MKKFLLFGFLFFIFSYPVLAQEDENKEEEEGFLTPSNYFVKQEIVQEKKPIPYPDVKEDDILWSTTIWRVIDCREKVNYPLYYPTVDLDYRRSLVQTLVDGIMKKKVQAYDTDSDEFRTKLTPEEVMAKFDAGDKVIRQQKLDGEGDTTIIIQNPVNWNEVREFMVKEVWIFDKHRSMLDVRIIGICPIRVYNKMIQTSDEDDIAGEEVRKQLFWVYYPEARRVLANTICYTGRNEQANMSFDDVMIKRRFSSYIRAESNSLNDRVIADYTRNGIEAIMESERIKDRILKLESDLWEY